VRTRRNRSAVLWRNPQVDFFAELRVLMVELEQAGVRYAACGGVAPAVHGAPRAIHDFDILVQPKDLAVVKQVIAPLGFKFQSEPMEFANGLTIVGFTKLIEGQPLMLDVLLVNETLKAVREGRIRAEFEGGAMQVVSKEGLITLKLSTARPQDLADVQRLKELSRG